MAEDADQPAGAAVDHVDAHLPGPSYWPALLAVGVAMSLIGVITKIPVLIIGLIVLLLALGGWIRDARRDYRELP